MRLINAFLIGLLIPSMALAGLPPTTIKGQTDASPKTKFGFQVPFQQATDLGGISSLIETGNSNILPDPGFEASVSGWTASGGATATANTTAKGTGLKGYDWDSNAAAQTLVSQAITIPEGFKGKNGTVSCSIKTVSGTATHTITADDGTNNIVSPQTIASSTSIFTDNKVNFVFPSSASIRVKITSVAANEPEIYVDDCRLGLADNIGTVQQARLIGTVTVTGCAAAWSVASTIYASFGTQAGCSYAVTGEALAPTTNIPAIRFASLPPGEYKLEYEGNLVAASGVNSFYQFFDGTNTAREQSTFSLSAATPSIAGISQSISYSSPQSNITLQIRAKSTSGSSLISGTTAIPGVIRVYHFPSASQQAVSSAQSDYDWTSYTPTLSAGFGIPTNVSFFHKRRGGDLIVKGTFTTGSVTAALGTISLPSGLTIDTTRTSINNLASANSPNVGMFNQSAANQSGPIVTATGSNTSVVYTGGQYSGSVTLVPTNVSSTMSSTAVTAINFTVPISGWNENQRAPTLVGSVTSNSNGAERIERAIIAGSVSSGAPASACTSSPCTIVSQSGNWLTSVTRAATGQYQLNIASGIFSAIPTCIPTSGWGGVISAGIAGLGGSFSSTAMGVNTTNITGTSPQDQVITVTCMGSR